MILELLRSLPLPISLYTSRTTFLSVAGLLPPVSDMLNQPDHVQVCPNEAGESRSELNVPPETGTDDSSRKRLRERGLWVGETGSSFQWTQFPEGGRHAYIYIDCHQNPKKQSWMTNGCPNSGSDGANVFSFTLVVILFPLPWCDLAIRRKCNMQMRDAMSIR